LTNSTTTKQKQKRPVGSLPPSKFLLTGRRQTVAGLPGFTRGLALGGPYAFVGLSKIRATSAMDGVPLAERREQLKCGVAVVDWCSGQSMALLEFQSAVEEIFDMQLLPGPALPRSGRLPEGNLPPYVHHPARIEVASGRASHRHERLSTSSQLSSPAVILGQTECVPTPGAADD
jgi:hypothetical protein